MKQLLLSVLYVAMIGLGWGQNATINVSVSDAKTGETLPGASVFVDGQGIGSTDMDGKIQLSVSAGKHKLTSSYMGYDATSQSLTISEGEVRNISLSLNSSSVDLNTTVVTGSRYEKDLKLETVSMEVMDAEFMKRTNSVDVSEALNKMPGITITDGQASIRGGSGFSYGVGSRVSLLVDGLPLLAADQSNIEWQYLPMENIQQVEVIKGSSSVLYGSGAMNGLINVLTAWPTDKPSTSISVYSFIYSDPPRIETRWWNPYDMPFGTGLFFNHSRTIGKNFDLVVGGNYHFERSYLENNGDFRGRVNFKTRYRHPKIKGLTFGVNGNFMYERKGQYFLWKNSDLDILRSYASSDSKYYYLQIDPNVHYFDAKGNRHSLRTRYFRKFRFGSGSTIDLQANVALLDYQYQRSFLKNMFTVTVGTTGSYGWVQSNLFVDSLQNDTNGVPKKYFNIYSAAVFAQLEFSWKRLQMVAGVRYELNGADSFLVTSIPVGRFGLNFRASESTFLRASFGQSYRLPSLAERFVAAELFPGFDIIPNFDLQPESGWSAEIGIKQYFKAGKNWGAYLDFAMFWMEYTNMIQYSIGIFQLPGDTTGPGQLGYKPFNVERARVAGFELTLMGKGKIGPVEIIPQIGYTYTYPGNLSESPSQENVGNYLSNMFSTFGQNLSNSAQDSLLLPFRNRHMFRGNLDVTWKGFSVGTTLYYNTFMEKIDPNILYLEVAIPGFITPYVNNRQDRSGDFFMDLRASYLFAKWKTKVSFVIKNVTNLEYAARPGILSPIRSFNLRFDFNF